jgi:hypothetical protein
VLGARTRHHRTRRPFLDGGLDEVVPVAGVALNGEEQVAGRERTGIDGDAGDGVRQPSVDRRVHGDGGFAARPERRYHRPASAMAARSSS